MKPTLWRNITFRWILMASLVIIPLNVLTLVITNKMADQYETQIQEAYENQLLLYSQSIGTEFSRIQDQVSAFLSDANRSTLIFGSGSDLAVDMVRLHGQLANARARTSLLGMGYVWNAEGHYASVFRQGTENTPQEAADLKEYLEQRDNENVLHSENEFLSLNGSAYLVAGHSFPQFSFGMVYDVEYILRQFFPAGHEIQGTLYLADQEGKLLASYSAEGFFTDLGMTSRELEKDSGILILEETMGFEKYRFKWSISYSDIMASLPALLNLLRVFSLVSLIALPLLAILSTNLVIQPLWKLVYGMKAVEEGDLDYRMTEKTSTFQMEYLYGRFNHMVKRIRNLTIDSYEKEIEKLQTDSINIRLQVNQHLLLNFLNTVYYLIVGGKQEEAGEFVQLLMKYFRYVLRKDTGLVRVSEEMQFIHDYLRMQRIRFPGSFSSVYSVSPEAEDLMIPQLLIVNFVENAVKYGLIEDREIEIIVNVRVEDERLLISVCDSGTGISEDVLSILEKGEVLENRTGKHIGIWNCRRRMKLFYGENYELKLTSREGEGTQVWISMPTKPLTTDEMLKKDELLKTDDC